MNRPSTSRKTNILCSRKSVHTLVTLEILWNFATRSRVFFDLLDLTLCGRLDTIVKVVEFEMGMLVLQSNGVELAAEPHNMSDLIDVWLCQISQSCKYSWYVSTG